MAKPIIVGVTGGSGSGKTKFVHDLKAELKDASIHSMDNYYRPLKEQFVDTNGVEDFDRLDSIDHKKFLEDLISLSKGETIELDEYTFNNSKDKAKKIITKSAPVILVEGIFVLFHEEIRKHLDLKIFIEAPTHLKMSRRIIRDAKERGYDLDDVLYRYQNHITPAFEKYIKPSKRWADIVIPNHENFDTALKVVTAFLNQ
ncbi:uridine kinase [Ekhidna sp.]|uniref:uridine kinase family protein n=1 Tax=Ekhidna sp. TaxID=2608089 RepID=UPI0035191B0A